MMYAFAPFGAGVLASCAETIHAGSDRLSAATTVHIVRFMLGDPPGALRRRAAFYRLCARTLARSSAQCGRVLLDLGERRDEVADFAGAAEEELVRQPDA